MPSPLPRIIPLTDVLSQNVNFSWFCDNIQNVCLRSVFVHFTDNICLSKTQTNTLSLFSYKRVTFTQIFIKGPFLFYSVLSSDIIIIGLVESLNT